MAELVYAFDLKSNGETRTGSSPVPATTKMNVCVLFCCYNVIYGEELYCD